MNEEIPFRIHIHSDEDESNENYYTEIRTMFFTPQRQVYAGSTNALFSLFSMANSLENLMFHDISEQEEMLLNRSLQEQELVRNEDQQLDLTTIEYKDSNKKYTCCSICSEEFTDTDKVCVLNCGHIFNHTCIHEWGHYKAECPVCKQQIQVVEKNDQS